MGDVERQRLIVNGRIQNLSPRNRWAIDLRRGILLAVVCAFLWNSNPGNNPLLKPTGWVTLTNYGFFSIAKYRDRVLLLAGMQEFSCYFRGRWAESQSWMTPFCSFVRDEMTHANALLWEPDNLSYSVHRIFVAVLITGAFYSFCILPSSRAFPVVQSPSVQGFLHLFLPDPTTPLMGLLWFIILENTILYPIWETMAYYAPLQHSSSWLKAPLDHPMADTSLIVLCVILLATATNIIGYHFAGIFPLRFDGIVAVGLGYYWGLFVSLGDPPLFSLQLLPMLWDAIPSSVSIQAMTWSTMFVAGASSLQPMTMTCFFFFVANRAGMILGQCHYEGLHTGVPTFLLKVQQWFGGFQ